MAVRGVIATVAVGTALVACGSGASSTSTSAGPTPDLTIFGAGIKPLLETIGPDLSTAISACVPSPAAPCLPALTAVEFDARRINALTSKPVADTLADAQADLRIASAELMAMGATVDVDHLLDAAERISRVAAQFDVFVSPPPPTPQVTPTAVPTPTPAPTPGLVFEQRASGSASTRTFVVGEAWTLAWSYDCSNFGTQGNFIVYAKRADGSTVGAVNQLGRSGASTDYFHQGGSLYLEVSSECAWHITVTG
jgi:hypothetical protein